MNRVDDYPLRLKHPTGRKHCGKCGCWRWIGDFHISRKIEIARGDGSVVIVLQHLQSWCMTCQRQNTRVVVGTKRQGKPYEPQKNVHGLARPQTRQQKDKRNARARELYALRKKRSPVSYQKMLAERRALDQDRRAERALREQLKADVQQLLDNGRPSPNGHGSRDPILGGNDAHLEDRSVQPAGVLKLPECGT
jgi:hypothetical protein